MSLGITGKLVLAFVTLLLGAVLVVVVATEGLVVTDKKTIGNEQRAFTIDGDESVNITDTYTVTKNPTDWKTDDCPLTSFVLKNASGGTALTLTTDYTITASSGVYLLKNTSTTVNMIGDDNNTYADYTYCGDDYMNVGFGRTVISLVGGFFALGILGASLGLFFSIAKDTGMI